MNSLDRNIFFPLSFLYISGNLTHEKQVLTYSKKEKCYV